MTLRLWPLVLLSCRASAAPPPAVVASPEETVARPSQSAAPGIATTVGPMASSAPPVGPSSFPFAPPAPSSSVVDLPVSPIPPAATPGAGEVLLESVATSIDDMSSWLASRHLPPEAIQCMLGCATLPIAGPKGELVRSTGVDIDDGGGATELSILLVDGHTSREVFSLIESVSTDPDGMGMGPGSNKGAGVTMLVRKGRDIVVVASGDSCTAPPAMRGKYAARRSAMCRAVGVYRWNGVRFGRLR